MGLLTKEHVTQIGQAFAAMPDHRVGMALIFEIGNRRRVAFSWDATAEDTPQVTIKCYTEEDKPHPDYMPENYQTMMAFYQAYDVNPVPLPEATTRRTLRVPHLRTRSND
jgi:hypothetical protein